MHDLFIHLSSLYSIILHFRTNKSSMSPKFLMIYLKSEEDIFSIMHKSIDLQQKANDNPVTN